MAMQSYASKPIHAHWHISSTATWTLEGILEVLDPSTSQLQWTAQGATSHLSLEAVLSDGWVHRL